MAAARDVDAARRRFWAGGATAVPAGVVRPDVLASWQRCVSAGVDRGRLGATFVGHDPGSSVASDALGLLDGFVATNEECGCSVLLVDADGVIRVRRDADPWLGEMLDAVRLAPGYCHAEPMTGTSAVSVALQESRAVAVVGPEHFHPDLTFLAAAAAPVSDADGTVVGVVAVCSYTDSPAAMLLPVARLLAGELTDHAAARRRRELLALHEAFDSASGSGAPWVVATDGDVVLVGAGAPRIAAADQQSLNDLALAGVMLDGDRTARHVDLPSGTCAEVVLDEVRREGGEYVGCVLAAAPVDHAGTGAEVEARRRQGSHVAPTGRRDFAAGLRGSAAAMGRRSPSAAQVRASRELLTPYLRARQDVAANLAQGRHQPLVGEAGAGKRTLALEQFARRHRDRPPITVDCASVDESGAADPWGIADGAGPQLVLLRRLHLLTPIAARRLDEALRRVVGPPGTVALAACLDTGSVDPTRPYGLVLRHFHETVRVPALRYRVEELGELAQSVLRSMTGGRSLRLSHQVVRVLEGYPWPGNISELEDVLRYVVARKPVGVIQPPDLPAVCFTSRTPKLSMLETAQCDAIIQALYEARGNRYRAAAMLGIARSSLYRKIDAFGISYIA